MSTLLNYTVRVLLMAMISVGLLAQTVIVPMFVSEVILQFPQMQPRAGWYTAVIVLGIAGAQAALVCLIALLSRIERGIIFHPTSLRWSTATAAFVGLSTVCVAALGWHLLIVSGMGGPGVAFTALSATLIGASCCSLMLIGRQLLNKSIHLDQQQNMEASWPTGLTRHPAPRLNHNQAG
ncbi:hypothetical protein AUR04nite_22400 [Glutamicibacter uratoxydans]|uniref:DUF2975 domain-containing protein n=1 Tax=Glutamicibacter uratoxydans TaxID=43667 RepID=A0A4Y4DTM8_GLUUR|nr:DUF2975 domain-containing protein [Glutamicibacter uratoxydans]GED06708.1 hypothetical protein AUR04nite_22400 [Glutamicibacter uratoxydans]